MSQLTDGEMNMALLEHFKTMTAEQLLKEDWSSVDFKCSSEFLASETAGAVPDLKSYESDISS